MKRLLVLLALLLLAGCSGMQHATPAIARCYDLERRYELWGAVAVGATVVAGSGALTVAAAPDDSKGAQLAIAVSAAGVAAIAAAAQFVTDDVVGLWAAECATDTSTAAE